VTTWTIGEAAAKCGLSQHTLLDTKITYYASCLTAPKATQ
jgi:hypothetical protein